MLLGLPGDKQLFSVVCLWQASFPLSLPLISVSCLGHKYISMYSTQLLALTLVGGVSAVQLDARTASFAQGGRYFGRGATTNVPRVHDRSQTVIRTMLRQSSHFIANMCVMSGGWPYTGFYGLFLYTPPY